MRFSAVQEDGFGVELGQDRVPSGNVDDSIMAAATVDNVSDGENIVDDCSMNYNLPLLFANGCPASLDSITQPDLERFITFMVQCSSGGKSSTKINHTPPWWPKEIQYSMPFVKPQNFKGDWIESLKRLVFRCYTYHRSEYLLRFCSYLAQYPMDKLYYVNNWDTTTSLYHRSTGKLLATFRNENLEYDKVNESPRRSLLPPSNSKSNLSSKKKKAKARERSQVNDPSLVVIQPGPGSAFPQMEEIFLCDNCDAEFGDFGQMKDHEKICREPETIVLNSRPTTPCETNVELDQDHFLNYFKLQGSNQQPKPSSSTPSILSSQALTEKLNDASGIINIAAKCIAESTRSSRRGTTVNLSRCPTIPISSPAGLIMARKSRNMSDEMKEEKLERIERHLIALPLNKLNRPRWLDRHTEYSRWSVTYKPNRERPASNYCHTYTFGAVKRKSDLQLSLRAQLFYLECKKKYFYVSIEKLTNEQLEDLKENPWKYKCPVRKYKPKIRPKIQQLTGIKRRHSLNSPAPSSIRKKRMKMSSNNNNNNNNNNENKNNNVLNRDSSHHQRHSAPQTIILVDLCSSDEDDDSPIPVLSDENLDPRTNDNNTSRTNFLKNNNLLNTGNKFRSKSLGGFTATDNVNEGWLRDSLLTDDNDKCTNNVKCLGSVIDSSNTFSTILKPAP